MSESVIGGAVPADTTTTDIKADIGRALFGLIDAIEDVQTGINAFLQVAADSKSEFSQTAHWMIRKVDADLGNATELANVARGALQVGERTPSKQWVEEAQAAAERLKAFVAAAPAEPGVWEIENTIRGALSDAVFMLACAQRWGQFEPIVDGLRRAGVVAPAGEA